MSKGKLLYGLLVITVVAAGYIVSDPPSPDFGKQQTAEFTKVTESPVLFEPALTAEQKIFQKFTYLRDTRFSLEPLRTFQSLFARPQEIDSYHFSNANRTMRLEGRFSEEVSDPRSDLNTAITAVTALENNFSEATVIQKIKRKQFTIHLAFPIARESEAPLSPPPPPAFSELGKMIFEEAIPLDRDSGLFSKIIPSVLEKSRVKLNEIQFDPGAEESPFHRLRVTLLAEGFVSDMFHALADFEKQSRFLIVDGFDINVTEVRSDMPLGSAKIQLSAFFR